MKNNVIHLKNNRPSAVQVTTAEIAGCLDSIAWTHRAMSAALPLLKMDDASLAAHVADEAGFAQVMQLVKALLVDRGYARDQAAMRKRVLDRVSDALAGRSKEEINAMLKSPINWRDFPEAQTVTADSINRLQP